MEWTAATVEGLAPDAASVAAARKLARPAPWTETGFDARAVWGLCRGSGARPYEVAVDLAGPAFKCSCPSRKLPCKHALALLLLRAGGEVAAGAAPERVEEWLSARANRPVPRGAICGLIQPSSHPRSTIWHSIDLGQTLSAPTQW